MNNTTTGGNFTGENPDNPVRRSKGKIRNPMLYPIRTGREKSSDAALFLGGI
ncbi:MAG: hypothetical protein RMZ41_003095 [Nostoc sp. DedVER02]|uniref:hypothetical protein n=1 Tax=unclassified Nostoc TaxID=2593658 RepID=UPI002AD52F45|nr:MULTISPECIES: hypothetical protein [unclassified Nostoc]MDZ7986858.1 hypothetical protein [Nostoc sp. DedVER02]MDZ8115760.1 hypothetical protein [Nostoc sp. DedVER01b]